MSKVWYCVNCGYEVGSRGRCHQCRERLLPSPLPELAAGDEDDEVGYRLGDWEDLTRGRLIESLIDAEVEHRFENDELIVAADDETRVDDLVATAAEVPASVLGLAEPGPSSPESFLLGDPTATAVPDDDDELTAQVARLHQAAGRLRVDPTDMEADGDVAEASAAVFATDRLGSFDEATWSAVGRTTRRLLAALGSEVALEDEIRRQAAILHTLLDDDFASSAAADPEDDFATSGAVDPDDFATSSAVDPEDDFATSAAAAPEVLEASSGAGAAEAAGSGGAEGPVVAGGPGAGVADPAAVDDPDAVDDPAFVDGLAGGSEVDEAGLSDGGTSTAPGGETVYELPEWLPEQRAELTVLLDAEGITSTWDGGDLVVPADREAEVEALFDRVQGVSNVDADDEARYRALEELFTTVSRLVGDPASEARGRDVIDAAPAVDGPTPLGFDDGQWWGIRSRARILADSLEHGAHRDVIVAEATALRDLLRTLV